MADEEEQQQVPGLAEGSGSVWVPHDQLVWKRAVVLRKLDDGKSAEVRLEPNNENEYHKDDGLVKVVNIQEISRQAGMYFVPAQLLVFSRLAVCGSKRVHCCERVYSSDSFVHGVM
jgi:hypothetical protein